MACSVFPMAAAISETLRFSVRRSWSFLSSATVHGFPFGMLELALFGYRSK